MSPKLLPRCRGDADSNTLVKWVGLAEQSAGKGRRVQDDNEDRLRQQRQALSRHVVAEPPPQLAVLGLTAVAAAVLGAALAKAM